MMTFASRIAAISATLGAVALALPSAALADEAWTGAGLDVFWESDMPDGAIFKYTDSASGTEGRVFVKGLSADQADRGTYKAIWIQYDEEAPCTEPLTDPTGGTSSNWGLAEVTFSSGGFPYSWTAKYGVCQGPLDDAMSFEPAQ